MVSFKSLLIILALAYTLNAHDDSKCGFNSYDHPLEFLDIEEDMSSLEEGRVLTSTTYNNIRIYGDYSRLLATAPTAYANYIQKELAPAVISFFEGALKVKYPVSGKLKLGSSVGTTCSKATPSILKTTGVDADFVYLFDSESESGTVVASSRYCYLASGSKRPIVATTVFNRPIMLAAATGDVLTHELNVYILLHEMMHSLGISDSTYKYFVDANGKTLTNHLKTITIAGESRLVIDVPSLTTKIRNYYGCSTIPGLIMENNGNSGTKDSHLERKFFVYETMSSGGIYGRRITQFSLGLLEASGWYVVDYDYAEPYYFGQGEGCNFINTKCSTTKASFDEFCTGSARGCANSGIGGGSCGGDSNADGCKYVDPKLDYHCENDASADYARLPSLQTFGRGLGSKCFTGTLNTKSAASSTSFCFKYTCSGSGSNTVLKVDVGKSTVTCSAAGKKTVTGYAGAIDCPDPLTFCNTVGVKYCPRNCLGRGTCVNNVCQCKTGFKGVDCGLTA